MKKLYTIKERVIRYLSKVNRIPQGKRNRRLYRLGIRLRTKFDLRLTDIEEALASVNRTKCEEPLSESEVAQIARSVAKSNKPIGEPSDSYSGQWGRSSIRLHGQSISIGQWTACSRSIRRHSEFEKSTYRYASRLPIRNR